MNLFEQGLLDGPVGFAVSLAMGALFGFWLERAGFGSSRKLTSIFYLQDFAVLKVMFSAMVTCALGLHLLAAGGYVDLATLAVPETAVWPQVVGGLVFGAGFVMGGWCPGTAAVGAASGRIDAIVFLAAAGTGSLLFASVYESVADFASKGLCATCSIPELLGVSPLVGALGLTAVALGAFVGATKVEQWSAARRTQ